LLKAETLDDERVLVRILNNAANYFMSAGDHGRAAELLLQHVAIDRRIGEPYGEATGLLNLAVNYLHLGLYASARDAAGQSLELTEALGARQWSAYNRLHLCLAHARLGEYSTAEQMLETAAPILEQVGDAFGRAVCCSYHGIALEAAEQAAAAHSAFSEAREKLNEIEAVIYAMDALAGLGRCALTQGDFRQAEQYTLELWDYLTGHGSGGLEFPILAYQTCAQVFQSLGDTTKALAAIRAGHDELMTRAEKISEPEWRRSFLENVAEHRTIVELWERHSN
jgi:tetratricopeptide (TPR) repeat protein